MTLPIIFVDVGGAQRTVVGGIILAAFLAFDSSSGDDAPLCQKNDMSMDSNGQRFAKKPTITALFLEIAAFEL
jgi:hypothetical protein